MASPTSVSIAAHDLGPSSSASSVALQGSLGQRHHVSDLTHIPDPHGEIIREGGEDLGPDAAKFALYGITPSDKRFTSQHGQKDQRFQEVCGRLRVLGTQLFRKHFNSAAKHNNVEVRLGSEKIAHENDRKIGHDDLKGKIYEIIQKTRRNATHFQMDFSDGTLRFLEDGTPQEIPKDQLPKEVKDIVEFLELLTEAHNAMMEMIDVRVWHTRFDIDGNRPMHGDMPFKLENPQWEAYCPKTTEEFYKPRALGGSHFDDLMEEIEPLGVTRNVAKERIDRASAFIDQFGQKLAARIVEKEQALAAAAAADKAKIQREIDTLKKLKERNDNIDRLAVFTAAALMPDNPSESDIDKIAEYATKVRLAIFLKTRGIDPEKFKGWHMIHGLQGPTQQELNAIGIRTGDLYYHSDLAYVSRFGSTHAIRMVRSSLEEHVIYNLMQRTNPDFTDDLRSFGLPTQAPEFQKELQDLVKDVRTAAAIQN